MMGIKVTVVTIQSIHKLLVVYLNFISWFRGLVRAPLVSPQRLSFIIDSLFIKSYCILLLLNNFSAY